MRKQEQANLPKQQRMENPLPIAKRNDLPDPHVIITVHSGPEHNKIILLNKVNPHLNPDPIPSLNNKNPK